MSGPGAFQRQLPPPCTDDPAGGVVTGRSVGSIRQEVNGIAERWQRSAQVLETEDQPPGEQLARLTKIHSSDVFYGCDEPLEATVFSVLAELKKEMEQIQAGAGEDGDVDR